MLICTNKIFANGVSLSDKVIVIDPGHGGFDPGKLGVSGKNEKDLNLEIALKLRNYFESTGAVVVMTRTVDEELDGVEGRHKGKDMQARREIARGGDILVSIHQNSFTQPSVHGAQSFYNPTSKDGKVLATLVQESIKEYADLGNKRVAKPNTNYYMLRRLEIPAVIVECGFLTNPEEENKLNSDEYQSKMAQAIYIGVLKYFDEIEGNANGTIPANKAPSSKETIKK